MRYLLALLMLVSLPAAAGEAMVWKSADTAVRLKKADCFSPTLAAVLQQIGAKAPARLAEVTHQGRTIPACWAPQPAPKGMDETKIIVVDADGDAGFILMSEFKPDTDV